MTSEVFKDRFPGSTVHVVQTGREAILCCETMMFDMVVLDFDLPDADGISLSKYLKTHVKVPILITAKPYPIVSQGIEEELFCYNDSMDWVPKPVRPLVLQDRLDRYLVENKRLQKRYGMDIGGIVSLKGEGRGKRSPRTECKIQNISIGGVMMEAMKPIDIPSGSEVMVSFEGSKKANGSDLKVKANMVWRDEEGLKAGFSFLPLNDGMRRQIEQYMRMGTEI